MYREHPIICPHCNKDTGITQESLMYMYLEHDIVCPHCGKTVIYANKMEWITEPTRTEWRR